MSKLRPECGTAAGGTPCMSYESAMFRIMQAVRKRSVLIHGRLHDQKGHHCAIGCAFDDGVEILPGGIVDEVALYNDSFPELSARERRNKVLEWLKFRVAAMRAKKS